ncbi:MAG: PDZ domain-containing protein, partial [Oscillospiraceae bacterium]
MKKTLRGVALLLALTLAVTPLAAALTPAETKALLEENYVDQLPQAAKDATTIEDILKALGDPYTQYFTPEEYKAFTDSMKDSNMIGLGIQFSITPDGGELLRVFAGSAAEKAGLVPGDLILSVNGTKLAGKTTEEIQPLMLGEVGTTVSLKLRHKDGKTETLSLKRTTYTVPATDAELVDGHIGYITCTTFGSETYGHFNDAITQNDAAADRWIVDLRGNLGGDVQAAVDATSAFTGGGDLAF